MKETLDAIVAVRTVLATPFAFALPAGSGAAGSVEAQMAAQPERAYDHPAGPRAGH